MSTAGSHTPLTQRTRWLLLAPFACAAVSLCLGFELTALSGERLKGMPITWTAILACAFNTIALALRWIFTKNLGRMFLVGRLPVAIGVAKLVAFAVICLLLVCLFAGLIAGSPYREITLRAIVLGLVTFGIFSFAANGVLNLITVARHIRGTLADTSQVR